MEVFLLELVERKRKIKALIASREGDLWPEARDDTEKEKEKRGRFC